MSGHGSGKSERSAVGDGQLQDRVDSGNGSREGRMSRTIQRLAGLHIAEKPSDYENVIFSLFEMFNTTLQIQSHRIEILEKKIEDDRIDRHMDARNVAEVRKEIGLLKKGGSKKTAETEVHEENESGSAKQSELEQRMDLLQLNTEQVVAHLENSKKSVEMKVSNMKADTLASFEQLHGEVATAVSNVQDKLNEILSENAELKVQVKLQEASYKSQKDHVAEDINITNNRVSGISSVVERTRAKTEDLTEDVLILKHLTVSDVTYHWLVDDVNSKRADAIAGRQEQCNSPPFYSHNNGYKMRLHFHPNGKHEGKGSHISLYLVLMQGPNDDHLEWPYTLKYEVSIIHPNREDLTRVIDPTSSGGGERCWGRPTSDSNKGRGWATFLALSKLAKFEKQGKLLVTVKIIR